MRFLECPKSAGKVLHVNNYLWSMMKKSSVSRMQQCMGSSDYVLCLGKMNQNPTSNTVWDRQLEWFKESSQYRTLDTIDGQPMEFEWNIFTGFTTLELVREVQEFMSKMGDPSQFKGLLSSCRCSMTSYGEIKTMKRKVLLIPYLCLFRKKISSRTLVIPQTWVKKDVVFH